MQKSTCMAGLTVGDIRVIQRIFDPQTHELTEVRNYGKGEAIHSRNALDKCEP